MVVLAAKLLVAVVVVSVGIGEKWVGAQVHHVVGDDRGWDSSSDVGTWSFGRIFRLGDKIWFTYSAAKENVVELKSGDEYESCDVSNPIRVYTNGLDRVSLDEVKIRYFASGKPESCKNGLKLHVDVQPQMQTVESSNQAVAAGPTIPSTSTHLIGLSYVFFIGLLICFVGL